jgi:hypothetical protein
LPDSRLTGFESCHGQGAQEIGDRSIERLDHGLSEVHLGLTAVGDGLLQAPPHVEVSRRIDADHADLPGPPVGLRRLVPTG